MLPEQLPAMRDARIDQIGFADEVQKQYVNDLRTAVKSRMMEQSRERAGADFFDALLISGASRRTIDPGKFLRLLEKGQITRAQFLSCLSIKNEPALEFMSRCELAAIASEEPMPPSLRISRKKGVEIELVAAVAGISQALKEAQ